MKKNKKKTIIIISAIVLFVMLFFLFNNGNLTILSKLKGFFSSGNISARQKYNFNLDWRFSYGEGEYNAESDYTHYCKITDHTDCIDAKSSPGGDYEIVSTLKVIGSDETPYSNDFDASTDERFTDVSLQHTFNDIDSFNNFTESGYNGDKSVYTGTVWYKKEFVITEENRGKKVYVEFEGARQAMKVYINGTELGVGEANDLNSVGMYENGFIPVGYDLTPYINYGATNYITVMVDNSFPYYMNGTTSAISWHDSHWHPNYGGLNRNSYLYIMDELHLTLPLYSFIEGEGTYIYASNITDDAEGKTNATINVDAQVENSNTTDTKTFTIKSTMYDAEGNIIGTTESNDLTLEAQSKNNYKLSMDVKDVKRWSTDYPYLYTVKTEIYEGNTLVDDNSYEIGIRTFRITSDYGFYLNENYQELNGWGQKSTMEWAGLGSAYPDWMTDSVIKLMKDANANYIRWGHTAGSATQIASCDKYGILVTQPGVDGEGTSANGFYDNNTAMLRAEAYRDMIIYFRNNPSIIMWELGNQSQMGSISLTKAQLEKLSGVNVTDSTSSMSLFQALYEVTNTYDYGNRNITSTSKNSGTYDDTITSNDRYLTVRKGSSAIASYIDVEETTLGDKSLTNIPHVEGEYNRLESPRGVWDKYTSNWSTTNTYYKTSEDYAISQIKNVTYVTGQVNIVANTGNVGGANWIFSDSTSHGRVDTEVARVSGEVDGVMLPKEAYYVDQVIFSKKPAIHIIGHWNYSEGTTKNVYVAAKGVSSVTLYVNDTAYAGAVSDKYLWTFSNISYKSGTIRVEGRDANGNILVTDSITTHGEPDHLVLTPIIGNEGLKANGSDILLVDVEMVDKDGNRCLTYNGVTSGKNADDLVTFTTNEEDGTSIWRGGYNSSIEYSTNSKSLYLESGINRIAIKTTRKAGDIIVNASTGSGITTKEPITLTSTSVDNTNGLSALNSASTYSLSSLDYQGLGNANKLGIEATPTVISLGSTLIKNLNYSENILTENPIEDAFGHGSKMYSDSTATFAVVPYQFYNAEYLLLPNSDKNKLSADYVSFEAKRDINVYVMHDPRVSLPGWLSTMTKTEQTVIGGNGVEYDVYMTSLLKGETITLGSNTDDAVSGESGTNQIIFVKETSKVNSYTFFFEDFTDFDDEALANSWNLRIVSNTSITVNNTLGDNALHLTDNITDDLAYVQKQFVPLTDSFKLKFKAYLPAYKANVNNWLRIWLNDGLISADDDKDLLAVETYLNTTSAGGNVSIRDKNVTTGGGVTVVKSSITTDAWHTYEIEVDLQNQRYKVLIDGEDTNQYFDFVEPVTSLDTIIIGTWKGQSSDYYVDEIEIVPTLNTVVENVKIDGVLIDGFSESIFDYNVEGLNEDSFISFDITDFYKSHSITYDDIRMVKTLTVVDIYDNEYRYYFRNPSASTILDDFQVVTADNTTAEVVIKDGEQAILLTDNNSAGMSYIQKNIGAQKQKFKLSWSAFVTDTAENSSNRVWITNGGLIGPLVKTNLGVSTYLNRNNNNLQFANEVNLADAYEYVENNLSLNAWHDYVLEVDVHNQTYDTYIDGVLKKEDQVFYNPQETLDTIIFGTRNSGGTGEYYVKNINVEVVKSDSPISGISIDGNMIPDFVYDTYSYEYYSEIPLGTDTIVDVIHTSTQYDSFTTEIDTLENSINITVKNIYEEEFVYKIYFKDVSERVITNEVLLSLISEADALTQSEYTYTSWDILEQVLNEAKIIADSSQSTARSRAIVYNKLYTAMNSLLKVLPYTEYTTGLFDNITYSEDLEGIFNIEKVLQPGAKIYKDNNAPTFRSIAKKYINAEYFLINNVLITTDGMFNFSTTITASKDLSIMIFKDYKAGPVTDESFTYTGDIATSSDGTVYKIYKKDYAVGEEININFKTLINNEVTNKNNIIAIKAKDNVDNNLYVNEVFSTYTTESFSKSWTVSNEMPQYNQIVIDETFNKNLYLQSTTTNGSTGTYAGAWTYLKFADQTKGKFKINFSFYADPALTGSTDNGYTRVWLNSNEVLNQNTAVNDNDKIVTVIESYIDYSSSVGTLGSRNLKVMYRTGSTNILVTPTKLSLGTWIDAEYLVDLDSKTWSAKIGDQDRVENLGFRNDLSPVNIFYLSTRRTGPTSMWFGKVTIEPVENGYINNISVNNTPVKDYTSSTLDYLVRTDELNVTYESTDDTTTKSLTDVDNYKNISVLSGSSEVFNQRVYSESDTNKLALAQNLKEALEYNLRLYTTDTRARLSSAIDNAKVVLQNLTATQEVIDAASSELRLAIDNLVSINNINIYYSAELYYGNTLDTERTTELNITNKSSFNFRIIEDITISQISPATSKRLVSDVKLPTGTKITLIDKSKEVPKYYNYTVSDTDTNEIELTNFKIINSTNKYYEHTSLYNSDTETLYEDLRFIVDFEEVETPLNTGNHTIKLVSITPEKTIDMNALSYYVSDKIGEYTMNLITDKNQYISSDDVIVNETITYSNNIDGDRTIIDTTKFNKLMGSKISLYKDGVEVPFPSSTIIYKENIESRINSYDHYFIMEAQAGSSRSSYTIDPGDYDLLDPGTYQIKIELIESVNGKDYGRVLATKEVDMVITEYKKPSFKVTSESKPVVKPDKDGIITYNFEKLNVPTPRIMVSLEHKTLTGYEMLNLQDYTNDILNEYATNIYNLGDVSSWTYTIDEYIPKGTYRLNFELYNGISKVSDIKKQFIVK